jgi:hypothetical protein
VLTLSPSERSSETLSLLEEIKSAADRRAGQKDSPEIEFTNENFPLPFMS